MSLLLVGVGLVIALTFLAGAPARDADAASPAEPVAQKAQASTETAVVSPEVERSLEKKTARQEQRAEGRVPVVRGPRDKTLKVTIPAMSQIKNETIPYAEGTNEKVFKEYAGVHLKGTGSPWEREANVYIAGHRLGYPTTDSWLAFWDLNRVEKGHRIFVTDANGKRYVYKVFKKFIVEPTQISVTRPLEGRNIVTLQTCTLPDYSQRLIVQAELVA